MTSRAEKSFGEELRALRLEHGFTLATFAAKMHYSIGHISKIERGHKLPTVEFAEECDRALECPSHFVALAVIARQRDSHFTIRNPAQLPAATAAFVGREERLAHLNAVLTAPVPPGSTRVAVIDGGPGIGKTAMALHWAHEAAHQFTDGQMFVNLHGYDEHRQLSAGDVLETFLRDLGVPPSAIPADEEARSALFRTLLSDKSILLVLDNAAASDQVLPLLPTGPGCAVVVTSRLHLSGLSITTGAAHVTLPPLKLGESVELLARIGSRPRVEAEPDAAATIVGRCARLPLAIHIAAEYVAASTHLDLAQLAEQLSAEENRLDLLPTADLPSLRAVFSWSYRSLPRPAARAFRLLGLSAMPSVSMRAVAALVGTSVAEARQAVGRLAAAHLVEQVEGDRVRLHDLLQAYGRELSDRHDPPGDQAAAIERLHHWYLHSAASANNAVAPNRGQPRLPDPPPNVAPDQFDDTDFDAGLRWCEHESASLIVVTEQAHRRGSHELAWLLAIVQFHFLYLAKPWNHWLRVTEFGLRSARTRTDRRFEAWCLHNLGVAHLEMRQFNRALRYFEPAMAIREADNDQEGLGWTTFAVGMVHEHSGQYQHASRLLLQSRAVFARLRFDYGVAATGMLLGSVYTGTGELDLARRELLAARDTFATIHAADGLAYVWRKLAWLERAAGDHDAALKASASALDVCKARDDRRGMGDALHVRGRVLKDTGRLDEARAALTEALKIFDAALDAREPEVRDELAELTDGA